MRSCSAAFHAYRPTLASWLDGGCDEHALYHARVEVRRAKPDLRGSR